MNLDLFLVQKVIQSLFKNDVNVPLTTPLELEENPMQRVKMENIEPPKPKTSERDKQEKKTVGNYWKYIQPFMIK